LRVSAFDYFLFDIHLEFKNLNLVDLPYLIVFFKFS
jgi:hypothetical protein